MASLTTQQFLEIGQIREGIIILKNRALRGVLMTSSLNFALKAEKEQNAIIYQFQNFLNSLDFSCQIVVNSRRLNITGYLDKLKNLELKQEDELLKIQIKEYHKFIENLIQSGTIMFKTFFIVIPFTILEAQGMPLSKLLKAPALPALTKEEFSRCKNQLWQRMEFVAMGLRRCGLQAVPLTTEELIEFFWALHHPREAEFGYYPEILPELTV
ncbi:MAG: hypothetical protein KY055_00590 [Candidatus Nealsonbacteria bacterium]|nr:hypothetical protein [Candidatus Nealsonbacteria bacterium]